MKLPGSSFNEFCDVLSPDVVKDIGSISNTSKKDAQFVTKVVTAMYANDMDNLKNKTASGKRNGQAITPEKCGLIKKIYLKRLGNCDKMREAKFGKHLKNAIETINRRKENKK